MNFTKNFSISSFLILILSATIGAMIAYHLFIGCCSMKLRREGFTGAPLDYTMGLDVPGQAYNSAPVSSHGVMSELYASLDNNKAGPVPPKGLFLYAENKFSPECCYKPQQYSSSTGCACISPEQMKFIASRGGNNTIPK